ncbi:MAG: diaminopimelate epimerase, partial [Myxococcales bacterium]|nr:diaminopimelate epimerase [Myxococcales bacterium]
MKLPFSKLHGLGNDFIVFDLRHGEAELGSDHAIALCDRHRGIGADGLLLLTGDLSEPHMQVINADGSVPEMCGNGLRCFVKYLVDKFAVGGDAITVVTGAGPLVCGFSRGGDTFEVSVAMGTPTYDPAAVPVAADKPLIDHALDVVGTTVHITGVGTGNPHMVLFDTLSEDERLRLGPVLSAHPLFPAQANVEFCTVLPPAKSGAGRLRCDVYE